MAREKAQVVSFRVMPISAMIGFVRTLQAYTLPIEICNPMEDRAISHRFLKRNNPFSVHTDKKTIRAFYLAQTVGCSVFSGTCGELHEIRQLREIYAALRVHSKRFLGICQDMD